MEDKELTEVEKAYQLIQEEKLKREQAFNAELQELCKKYGIKLSSQIIITAI